MGRSRSERKTRTKTRTQKPVPEKFQQERTPAPVVAQTNNQRAYIQALHNSEQTFVLGPAGTGKTFIAASIAADMFRTREVSKIVVTRPNVPCGRSLGFFPGSSDEKMAVWCVPILEVLRQRLGNGAFDCALAAGQIEMVPLETIRGRSFKHAFIIFDEAQNASVDELKAFLMRQGEDCVSVINGDLGQKDIQAGSGLAHAIHLIKSRCMPVPIIELAIEDIVRSGLCREWVLAFEGL